MPYQCVLAEDAGESPWQEQQPDGSKMRWSLIRLQGGAVVRWSEAPIGTMVIKRDCQYDGCRGHERGGCLLIKLPNPHDPNPTRGIAWYIDHPGSDGCVWQRAGEPPKVTATPSINFVGIYHGWVREGQVVDA